METPCTFNIYRTWNPTNVEEVSSMIYLPYDDEPVYHSQSFLTNINLGYKNYISQNNSNFYNFQLTFNRYGFSLKPDRKKEYSIVFQISLGFSLSKNKNEKMKFLNY